MQDYQSHKNITVTLKVVFGVLRTLCEVMEYFLENTWQLLVVNYFCQKLHHRLWKSLEYASDTIEKSMSRVKLNFLSASVWR